MRFRLLLLAAFLSLATLAAAQTEATDSRLTDNRYQSRESQTIFTEEMAKANIPESGAYRFLFGYCTLPYLPSMDECWLYYDKAGSQLVVRLSHQETSGRTQWTLPAEGAIIDSLAMLTQIAIDDATHEENIGGNGTYYLFISEDGHAATTWSPKKGSLCRRLVKLYRDVSRAVKNADPLALENLQGETDALIRIFRRGYSREWR